MTPRVIVLDTNLALLLIVGAFSPAALRTHKRLEAFDEVDFAILGDLIARSDGVLFCPHVLAEASNLLRLVGEPLRTSLTLAMGEVIKRTEEDQVQSATAVGNGSYARLGLTDAILLELTKTGRTLLTSDLDLYLAAETAGKAAINFTHLQAERPDFHWR